MLLLTKNNIRKGTLFYVFVSCKMHIIININLVISIQIKLQMYFAVVFYASRFCTESSARDNKLSRSGESRSCTPWPHLQRISSYLAARCVRTAIYAPRRVQNPFSRYGGVCTSCSLLGRGTFRYVPSVWRASS